MYDIRMTPAFSKWLGKLKDRRARARIAERLLRLEQGILVIISLLVGGDKSTQNRDIEKAREIMEGFEK